jgi:hypothetical protein
MENEYLEKVLAALDAALVKVNSTLGDYRERVRQAAADLWEET